MDRHSRSSPGSSDDQCLQHFIDCSYTILQAIKSAGLAIDTGIKRDAIDRIISVIRVTLVIFLGPYDVHPQRAVAVWSVLEPQAPLPLPTECATSSPGSPTEPKSSAWS